MPRFRENIRSMTPYIPPLEGRGSKDLLLLDFNEMTVKPSQRVTIALKEFIDSGKLQAYPEYGDLDEKISEYARVKNSEVIVTNGSDQALDIIMRALLDKSDRVIIPTPSFAIFYQSAKIQGAEILTPFYRREDLSFPLKETLNLIGEDIKLLIICNPNNPTGTSVSRQKLIRLLDEARKNDVAVLHDEAYFEFSGITAADLIKDYENLFITRTFSKQFGLASVRAGYILSQKENISQLLKIRGPYDVNMFAKTAIIAALKDLEYAEKYIDEIMKKSKPKLEAFFRKNNIIYYPSTANFILIKPNNRKRIIDNLRKHGILVRPREGANIEGTVRITVGTLKDTENFINTYSKILRN